MSKQLVTGRGEGTKGVYCKRMGTANWPHFLRILINYQQQIDPDQLVNKTCSYFSPLQTKLLRNYYVKCIPVTIFNFASQAYKCYIRYLNCHKSTIELRD